MSRKIRQKNKKGRKVPGKENTDGSTINVIVDGFNKGKYNFSFGTKRTDVKLF